MEHVNDRLINFASIVDSNTLQQAELTAKLPFVYPHVALMPDAHSGKGATVGSVIPTLGAVVPSAVGVDIGCGIIACQTRFNTEDIKNLNRQALREAIETAIPLSAGKYNTYLTESARSRVAELIEEASKIDLDPAKYAFNWQLQLGSLGSGNHFIEVSKDQNDSIWLLLHSGSRGIGNKIASHHIKVAQELMKRWWIELPDPDLAYLVMGTPEFNRYMKDLAWTQKFAAFNRAEMMDRVISCFEAWLGGQNVEPVFQVNCHHNYTSFETHYNKKVIISRKGAIDAHEGVWGVIPGSMGDATHVVVGKGYPPALMSAPHGAGRLHSRSQASRLFTQDQLRAWMRGKDIEYRDTDAFLDEYPEAYKPIDQVMADSVNLVDIKYTLKQLINVKGN